MSLSKDLWSVSSRPPFKFIKHKKFPFIQMTVRKKGYSNWLITLHSWDKNEKTIELNFHYKKLTKDKYKEILYAFLRSNDAKHAIFNYLFKGDWKV